MDLQQEFWEGMTSLVLGESQGRGGRNANNIEWSKDYAVSYTPPQVALEILLNYVYIPQIPPDSLWNSLVYSIYSYGPIENLQGSWVGVPP